MDVNQLAELFVKEAEELEILRLDPPFKRNFLMYESFHSVKIGAVTYSSWKGLNFISYWLIYLIHGPEKLEELSAKSALRNIK